jgi:flavin reductase (DIM6/NTAB) family NADH-FMN oxidoreductase RutF
MSTDPLSVISPIERFFGYYPGTVAVITSAHAGARNVMAAGWHAALSAEPPLYGVAIGRERHSHPLIVSGGHFAVHFLPFERADIIAGVGSVSGGSGIDKFAHFGLTARDGVATPVPVLQEAYLAYECKVVAVSATGDHDWIVGEVMALHHRTDAYDERYLLKTEVVRPAIFYGRSIFEALGAGERAVHTPPR